MPPVLIRSDVGKKIIGGSIKMEYVKSPLNYTGGKFKLLPQLLELYPKNINIFVDLFAGGGNVSVNVKANNIIYNDIIWQVSEMLTEFRVNGAEECTKRIDEYIDKFELSKDNVDGYLRLRNLYNSSDPMDPVMLYTLICYSFNNQIRFNSRQEYNMPFGKDRSSFNPALMEKFLKFVNTLQGLDIEFQSKDFRTIDLDHLSSKDLVYCDPPYLITVASYNENGGWGEKEEIALLSKLDALNKNGVRFALSNVLESKGKSNDILKLWAEKYNINYLNHTYSNCSYHKKDKTSKDVEVLITNY